MHDVAAASGPALAFSDALDWTDRLVREYALELHAKSVLCQSLRTARALQAACDGWAAARARVQALESPVWERLELAKQLA